MCLKSVYDSIYPLHMFSKFVGFALFSFHSKSRRVYFSKTDGLLAVFHLILLVFFNYLYWSTKYAFKAHGSEIVKAFFPTVSYTNFIVFTFAKLWTFSYRRNYEELLDLIHQIDDDLERLGFKFDYQKERKFVMKLILCMNLVEISITLLVYLSSLIEDMEVSWNVFLFTSFGFISNMVLINQFITSVIGVNQRYKAVNSIIG